MQVFFHITLDTLCWCYLGSHFPWPALNESATLNMWLRFQRMCWAYLNYYFSNVLTSQLGLQWRAGPYHDLSSPPGNKAQPSLRQFGYSLVLSVSRVEQWHTKSPPDCFIYMFGRKLCTQKNCKRLLLPLQKSGWNTTRCQGQNSKHSTQWFEFPRQTKWFWTGCCCCSMLPFWKLLKLKT